MPIKRRDRDNEGSKTFQMEEEHIPTDQELFLQAFEKPTQIYRYLRTRNNISPIFLHRTLNYMKDRMSRNHKRRKTFKVDSLLSMVVNKSSTEAEKNNTPGNYMTLTFLGLINKAMLKEQLVEINLIISKISHLKRKDSFKAKQDNFGTVRMKSNSVDMIGKVPAISVPSEYFKPVTPGSSSRSCILQINVSPLPETIHSENGFNRTDSVIYECEMLVFDKHNRCVLSDGNYEISLHEKQTAAIKTFSPKKHLTWEEIPENCLDEFSKSENPVNNFNLKPTLEFRLSWTKDKCNDMVDRPLPITIRKDDNFMANKENEPNQNQKQINNGLDNGGPVTLPTLEPCTNIIISSDDSSRIIYHFICNNNSSQQTEAVDNFICPWCSLRCMTLYSLLKHLKLYHARFNFTYVPSQNGVRVDVSINNQFDGSYIGSTPDHVGPAGSAFAKSGPERRTSVTSILVCHPPRAKPSLTEFLEIDENEINSQRPYITGHTRQYHHTMTCLPILPKELDMDSEDENDPAWLQHKTMQMIDEFTDVNEGEKELMKMWNLHIMRNGYVGDIQIQLACEMFLDIRGHELLQKNLYKNFMLHLCNLYDFGLLSPEGVYKIVQKLHAILQSFHEGCETLIKARETQMDYWMNIGVHKQKEIQPTVVTAKRKLSELLDTESSDPVERLNNNSEECTTSNNDDVIDCNYVTSTLETNVELHCNDQPLITNDGSLIKKLTKADINSNDSMVKRQKIENDVSKDKIMGGVTTKRRLSLLNDSLQRRRSFSASLTNPQGNIPTRRNSLATTPQFRKGKRLSVTKIGK